MPRDDNENQYRYGAYDYRTQNEDNQRYQEEQRQEFYERQLDIAQEQEDERRRQEAEESKQQAEKKEEFTQAQSEPLKAPKNTEGSFRSAIPTLSLIAGAGVGIYVFSNTDDILKGGLAFAGSGIVMALALHAVYYAAVLSVAALKFIFPWAALAVIVIGLGVFFNFHWANLILVFIMELLLV